MNQSVNLKEFKESNIKASFDSMINPVSNSKCNSANSSLLSIKERKKTSSHRVYLNFNYLIEHQKKENMKWF